MATKIHKLNIEAADTGIDLNVDGAPEGIHIEYEILTAVMAAMAKEAYSELRFNAVVPPLVFTRRIGLPEQEETKRTQTASQCVGKTPPKIPEEVEIISNQHLWIDGEEFPWTVLGVTAKTSPNDVSIIEVTIPAMAITAVAGNH
ncbi:hypothetical protein [Corynebacterium sp. TAE3-ERU2]|uniref:hypothetical protein n=1 Tax=Corynebacterium sp. TAE3-ERU2 TaxID=2849497 RepID=UPI001C45B734|nr:hypothetical protein [Corynebacterium sp. TAE3-ERU2]MBV7302917.1 hypothetical protein [Corynebacterium sp. TAE3-ERU2]